MTRFLANLGRIILKLDMKHQEEELYKVYILVNHDLGMTLTYFTAGSTLVIHEFQLGKLSKCDSKGIARRKWTNGLKIYNSERKKKKKKIWTPGAGLPHPGAIYMYITIMFKDLLRYKGLANQSQIL